MSHRDISWVANDHNHWHVPIGTFGEKKRIREDFSHPNKAGYKAGRNNFVENKQMANTYTQLHIQFVFAVKYRQALISKSWKEQLHRYITGIIQANQHKVLQVNSMPDHIHIFIGMRPVQSISALVQNVKTESSKWINANNFCPSSFAWQEGYGAFSYAQSQVPTVIRYIQNQETHHAKTNFRNEYRDFLEKSQISYDEQYIFIEPE